MKGVGVFVLTLTRLLELRGDAILERDHQQSKAERSWARPAGSVVVS